MRNVRKMKSAKALSILILSVMILFSLAFAAAFSPKANTNAESAAVWDGTTVATKFSGGDGTSAATAYEIKNGAELKLLSDLINQVTETKYRVLDGSDYVDKVITTTSSPKFSDFNSGDVYYKLTADIVLNDLSLYNVWSAGLKPANSWTPIGNGITSELRFAANFDGGSYAVYGVYISVNAVATTYQGLFGYISATGRISNVGIKQSYISANTTSGDTYAGGVAGYNGGIITDSYNTGAITASGTTTNCAGGVAGYNGGTITNCYNTGMITASGDAYGSNFAGGIAGNNDATITNCYNTGMITASDGTGNNYAGGVAGSNSGTITNCYNTGAITVATATGGATSYAGGVVGYTSGTITNSYNTGTVTASGGTNNSRAGGVAGSNSGTITNSYNTGTIAASGGTTTNYAGGAAGYTSGTITNCYNTGAVTATGGTTSYAGGVAGFKNSGTIANCYFLDSASGGTNTGIGSGTGTNVFSFDSSGKISAAVSGSDDLLTVLNTWVTAPTVTAPSGVIYAAWTGTSGAPYPKLMIEVWGGATDIAAGFAGGDGSSGSPYQISNGAQLAFLAQQVNLGTAAYNASTVYYVLTCDIYLNNTGNWQSWASTPPANSWTAIGTVTTGQQFAANFDGGNFAVYGVYIKVDAAAATFQGLFGYVGSTGKVANVGVKQSYISASTTSGSAYAGGVAGSNDGTITNSYNTGTVSGSDYVGGVVGYIDDYGTITNSYNTGTVSGTGGSVGGVAGYVFGSVTNSYNTGTVSGTDSRVGGVAGSVWSSVTNCYNTGAVTGTGLSIGGVAGYNGGTITNCYNTGAVSGTGGNVGGVAGSVYYGTATNCYFLMGMAPWAIGSTSGTVTISTAVFNASGVITQNGNTAGADTVKDIINITITENTTTLLEALNAWVASPSVTAPSGVTYAAWTGTSGAPYPKLSGAGGTGGMGGTVWDGTIASVFAGGDGTSGNPYQISNGAELAYLASLINAGNATYNASSVHYKLTANIVLNDTTSNGGWQNWSTFATETAANTAGIKAWTAIGISTLDYLDYSKAFQANFDGNNYTVSGIYINKPAVASGKNYGLFGYVYGGNISNLGVEKSYIKGYGNVGGIAGYVDLGTISNCYNSGSIQGGNGWSTGGIAGVVSGETALVTDCNNSGSVSNVSDYTGGIAGNVQLSAKIVKSYNTGTVSGTGSYVGGVAGYITESSLTNCYNTGSVTGTGSTVGGVAGIFSGTMTNCYNTGSVTGTGSNIGGVAGYVYIGTTVINCYNTGAVSGSGANSVGGVAGYLDNDSSIINSFNTGLVSGANSVGGVAGNVYIGTVTSCYNMGNISGTGTSSQYIGGVAGYLDNDSSIINSFNTGLVSGANSVGGVAGNVYIGTVTSCYNTGNVSGSGRVGGVAGEVYEGEVSNCYNTGKVEGTGERVGGVAGEVYEGEVSNCYNTGIVSGTYASGVAGIVSGGRLENCFNTGAVTAEFSGGIAGIVENGGSIINCYFLQTNLINSGLTAIGNGTGTNCFAFDADGEFLDDEKIVFTVSGIEVETGDLITALNLWVFNANKSVAAGGVKYLYFTAGTGSIKYIFIQKEAPTVTFDLNGASGTAPDGQSIFEGFKAVEPDEPTRAGYDFGGWYKDSACENEWDFDTDTVNGDITLYAKWEDIRAFSYTITKIGDYYAVAGLCTDDTTYEVCSAGTDLAAQISAIAADAGSQNLTIQFGDGTNVLDIGTAYITFDGSVMSGKITLSGKITSAVNTTTVGAVYLINGASVESTADIANTSTATSSKAIYNASTGAITVSGGVVSATSGRAIANDDEGAVNVTGGTVSATTGYAIYNASTGTVNISGGTVKAIGDSGRAIYNSFTGAVNISGGTVSATTGAAIYNFTLGVITISQAEGKTTLITSANVTATEGTIYLANSGTETTARLIINGGTVKNNTADGSNATAIYNASTGAITISGGVVLAACSGRAIYNKSTGAVNISGGTISSDTYAVYNNSTGAVNISGGIITSDFYAVYNNNASGTIVLKKDPTITGKIRYTAGSLSVATGTDAFSPTTGKMYNLELTTAVASLVAVTNGNGFLSNFTLSNTGYTLNVSGNDLAAALKTYTVTYDLNGGGETAPSAATVNHGDKISAAPTGTWTLTGYTHDGKWYTRTGSAGSYTYTEFKFGASGTTVTANTTLYLKWTINSYTVTYNLNGGSGTAPTAANVDHGGTIATKPGTSGFTLTGYTNDGKWYTRAGSEGSYTYTEFEFGTTTITANTTLYLKWTINSYTVTYNLNGGSGTAPTAANVDHGGTIATKPSTSGFTLTGYTNDSKWYTRAGSEGSYTYTEFEFGTTTITANTTLYLKWRINSYTVTYDLNGGSGTAPTAANVDHGGTIATKPGTSGFTLTGYTNDGKWYTRSGSEGSYTYTEFVFGASGTEVTGAVTLYLKWTAADITFSGSTLSGGTYNTSYSAAATASCTAGGTITYALKSGSDNLPGGLGLNTSTGAITGTPTAAGTFTFTITATHANGKTADAEFTIVIAKKQTTITASGKSATYTGNAHAITAGTPESLSLTITYYTDSNRTQGATTTAPTNARTYYVRVTLVNNNYSASAVDVVLTIGKADPTVSVSVKSSVTIYTHSSVSAVLEVSHTFNSGTVGGTLEIDSWDDKAHGTGKRFDWTFTPDDTDNFNTVSGYFTADIAKDDLKDLVLSVSPSKTGYTAFESFNPAGMTLTARFDSGAELTLDATDYTVIYQNGTSFKAGDTKITLRYTSDGITKTKDITVTVNKIVVTSITFPTAAGIVYSAALSTSVLNGGSSTGSFAWVDGTIIPTVSNSGYSVLFTPSDLDNYDFSGVTDWNSTTKKITRTVQITVTAKTITADMFTVAAAEYSGTGVTPSVTLSVAGAGITFNAGTYSDNINAGIDTASVSVTGTGNYSGIITLYFTISRRQITVTPTSSQSKTYGETDPALTYTITSGSLVAGETLTGALAREAGANAGQYIILQGTLTNANNANYDITLTTGVKFTIDKVQVMVVAPTYSGGTLTYGDGLPVITGSTTGGTYTLGMGQTLTAGTKNYNWTFTPEDTDNYEYTDLTGTISLTVTKAAGLGSVSMESWISGTTAANPTPVSSTNGTANVSYEYKAHNAADNTYTAIKPSAAGNYIVRATFAATDNYNSVSVTVNFTIFAAAIVNPSEDPSEVVVEGSDGTKLDPDVTLHLEDVSGTVTVNGIADNKEVLAVYDVYMLLEGAKVQPDGEIKITVKLTEEQQNASGLKLLVQNGDVWEEKEFTLNDDGTVSYYASNISAIAFAADILSGGDVNLTWLIVLLLIIILLEGGFAALCFYLTKKNKKSSVKTYSFAAMPVLFAAVSPAGAIPIIIIEFLIIIGLGVWIAWMFLKNPQLKEQLKETAGKTGGQIKKSALAATKKVSGLFKKLLEAAFVAKKEEKSTTEVRDDIADDELVKDTEKLDEEDDLIQRVSAEEELSESELITLAEEDVKSEEQTEENETQIEAISAEEKAAESGEVVIDEETSRIIAEAEKERIAFIEAKKAGETAIVPALRFTLSREDIFDYTDNAVEDYEKYPVAMKAILKRKKHYCDTLYCGEWCYALMYETMNVIKLTLRMDSDTADVLDKKYTAFKPALFPKGEGWYDLIVDSSFGSKKEVYEILDASYAFVLSRYYRKEHKKYITDIQAAKTDSEQVETVVEENISIPDASFELAILERETALDKFRQKNKAAFKMTRKRMLFYAKSNKELTDSGKVFEREKRYLPSSLKVGGKTYALVYEKAYIDKTETAANAEKLKKANSKKGALQSEPPKSESIKIYVSLTVRIPAAYAEWLSLRHPEVCRARFPKNRNWYVVPVDGSFPNAQMVYRILKRAKKFVSK